MVQEEKELLLKDLSARLPYGVVCSIYGDNSNGVKLCGITSNKCYFEDLNCKEADRYVSIDYIKPYLRSWDDMTEEEKNEYNKLCSYCLEQDSVDYNISTLDRTQLIFVIDWVYEHHLDPHGLIEKGLAHKAPEGMYNMESKIKKLLKEYFDIYGTYTISTDGIVDVEGGVKLRVKCNKLPVKFGVVKYDFDCYDSELTSLEGCPEIVGRTFDCGSNNLMTLEGAPDRVLGNFHCSHNNLTSLEGCPKEIGNNFSCCYNKLTSLEGSPKEVRGNFVCHQNPKKFTREECPSEIGGEFYN